MYCVDGESGSSLLIESTDSMIASLAQNTEDLILVILFQKCMTYNVTMHVCIVEYCLDGSCDISWF